MTTQITSRLVATTIGVLMTVALAPVDTVDAAGPVSPLERWALTALYEQTNGESWIHDTNWRTPDGNNFNMPGTECSWYGVTCNADSSVVMIDLHDNNLTGQIPIEIVNLKSLKFLRLTSNSLSGTIPSEIGYLLELEFLWLSSNQLTGSIPNELGLLNSLVWFKVNNNQLSGQIPRDLGYLSSLEYLGLSHNHLTGSLPPELGYLTTLVQLELDANGFTGPVPAGITSLSELKDGSGLSSRWNAVYAESAAVDDFLHQKHEYWGDWQATQTQPPASVEITSVGNFCAWLNWTPDEGQAEPGGFEVFYAPSGSEEWTSAGWTANKTEEGFPVTGLTAGAAYDFAVVEFTHAHENNDNPIQSDLSLPVSAMTADLACGEPVIIVNSGSGSGTRLSVQGDYDGFEWSTGETTATIDVNPTEPVWIWVNITGAGSCAEAAAVYVEPTAPSSVIFSDGFESNDMSAWS